MRLTNKIRKEIVASMIECVYRPKIKSWEIKTHQFIKDIVKQVYDTEIKWYQYDVDECFKQYVTTKSTFGVTARREATDDDKYPSIELLQPLIECRVQTIASQKSNANNYICNIGNPRDGRWYFSDITKLQVDVNVPCTTNCVTLAYNGNKKKLTGNVKEFFDIKSSKRDLEKEICDAGEKWFSALLSVSTIEKMIEKMPKLEKYIPEEVLEPKVNTSLVPVELYDDINNIIP